MKRIIKFRGRSAGKWYFGDLEYNPAKKIARIHSYNDKGEYDCQHIVDPDTIGQFTGLYDTNGKSIYEGDMFDLREFRIMVVYEAERGSFILRNKFERSWSLPLDPRFTNHYGIIGNIYDNPELMEKGGQDGI